MTYKEYVAKKNAGTLTASSTPVTTYAEYRKRKDSGLLLTDADFSSGTNEATDWVKKYQGLMAEAREAGGDTSLLSADYRERIGDLLSEYDILKDYGKTIYKNFDKYAQQLMALGGKYDTATGTPKDLYAVKPTNNWTGVILGDNPVMQTPEQMIAPTSEAENNTWFQKGALEDGVTLGNVGKAILGTHQDLGENFYAGVISMGEKAVDKLATIAPYIVQGQFYQNGGDYAPIAYQQMYDQAIDFAKKGTEDFVQQDLYDEKEVAKALTKYSVGNLAGGSDMSVLGGKSDALVQSGGQMAATLALSSAGVPWWLTTGVTAFGGESENALKQGASLDEAAMSSAIAAGAEILTEKLFGGSGLGEQGLMNLEPLTRGITNRTVKILADYGVDLAAEGFEETLTEVINNLGSTLYREENLKDILASEEALTGYLDAFIGGMVMSGAMNVGKVSNHLKQQTDYRSDLTKQEQQVVDKEYQRLLAEKDGELTNKQKNDLYNRVIRDMEKGYISTDTIEEVLGGDTYKAYQDMVNSHDSLTKQLETLTKESDQLEDMVDQEMTGRQKLRRDKLRDLIPELQSKVKENNESNAKKDLKQRLSDEVSELVKNDRLSESYAEKNRIYDKLDLDPDTYKDSKHADAARKTIESAVALDANNTNRVRDLVEHSAQIASETGKAIIFKDNDSIKQSFIERQTKAIKKLEAVENRTEAQNKLLEAMKQKLEDVKSGKVIVNGEYSKDGIIVNIDSKKPLIQTVGHEITHNTESAKSYGKMKDALFAYAKTKGIDAQTLVDMAMLEYEGIENAVAEREVVADLVGEMLFTDDAFVEHLAQTETNVFKSLWNDIKHLLNMATPGSQEAKELEKLQYRFEKAYREANKAQKNTTEDGGVKRFTHEITEDQNEQGLDAKDETEYSLSRNTEFMDKAITANESNFHVSSDVMTEAKTVRERIANRMNEIKDRGLVGLPEDIEGNTYIANSSYDGTEENTTICPRSLASEAFVDAVSEYLGRPLSVEEQIYISQDLQGRSLTPECTYCYVATDRKAYRAFLGEYINQRNAVLEKVKENPGADVSRKGDLYKEFLNGRKDTNPMYSRFKMWIDAYKSGKPMVEASHLANINKLMGDINSEFGAELKPQIVDAMKYAQSASWAKKRVNYVAYNGHILNWKQDRINKLNSHYGLRMYSFSDFHPAFVLENMQMITDASVRGLKMLGYTKDTDFVEIFAPSGMNINVSTFGFESGGNVYENNIIGAEWDKAKALREQYPNVGITFVATNDTIVEWALNQDWIDVVIPYHLVRTGTEVAKAFGYTNYTSESSDTKDAGWIKGKDNKYIAPTEHNNDKATYMAALEKNHLKPRFARFVDNPNYMKLVNECRQPASKSKPVQPIFNEDAAMTALAKLEANGYYQPIGGSVDRMYEIAAEVAEDMKNQLAPVQNSLSIADASYEADERFVTGDNFRMKQKPADIAPVKSTSRVENVAPVASYAMETPDNAPVMEAPIKNAVDVAENDTIEAVAPMPAIDSTRQVYAEPDDLAPMPTTGKKLRSWPVTSTESDVVDGEIALEDLDQDKIHYQPISNKKTLGNANAMLGSMGYDKAVSYMKQRFIANKVSLDDIALGERLIQEAVARKDHKTASDLIMDISILGTELGQKVQALSIIKKLTPEGQLKMLYKTIERGKAKGDKAFANIEVTPEQAEKILSARNNDGSYDQEKLNAAVEEVKQEIADQMPVTALEKINEWRYLAMLGNPKTHIRNLVSNVAMYATRQIKNVVARTGETFAGNRIERTKAWKMASKDVKEFAKQAADEMYSGDMGNKYSEASSIKSKRDIFRVGALNAAADFNSKALSQEDTWFSKPAYRESLQEYLTANGIRTKADLEKNSKLIAKAKEYAKKQALEATFQQDSYIANKISEIESRNAVSNVLVGAVLPFKKTPINIAKTAVAYSPLGIARNIADAVKVNKGEMAASEAIDHVAQTLTGTSLAVLGFFLAKSGFLNGAGKDDKEGKYDYQLGKQAYSVNINGDTYSLSWLSPVAMPLFVGVNAYEVLVEEKELDYNVVMDALFKTLDPLNEMSFLSSLNDVLSSYESGMAAFGGMLETAVQSYVTSFVPTLFSQIAQMTDTKKRTTKVAADSGQDFLDDTWNQIKYKIPGLRQTLEPSTDIWGNEIPITDNLITKAIETFLAPYAKKDNIATQVDEEIKNVYRLTGETGVIPNVPDNYITYKDVKYEMSAEDYTQFKKDYGQIAYKLMEQLVSNYTYQRASAVDKADMMKEVFTYARDEAKRNYLAKQGVEYTNATKNNVEYYRENNIKGAIETDMTLDEYVFRRDNPAKYQASSAIGGYDVYQKYAEDTKGMDLAKKAEYISRMDLTIDQKNRLINSETDRKEQIDLTGLENYPSFEEFEYAKENPESYALAKSLGGYEAYKVYAEALGDIKADKNQNGDTISNSRKNKVYNYIYSLDIPDIEKHILFKSQYTSTDTYNRQILEYLDSRDDISWDETKSILTKLGFKITSSGAIRW